MSQTDRIIGNLQKGVVNLEATVDEIRADVKKLLAAHNRSRGFNLAISAIVGGVTGLFTGLIK